MSLHSLTKLMASLSFLACTSAFATPVTMTVNDPPSVAASATPITVRVRNVQSVGLFGDPANTVTTVFVGANAFISAISFNVNLTAYPSSTLGDISVAFTDTTVTDGVFLSPADGSTASGTATFAGLSDLVLQGSAFTVGSDGLLRFEFFENSDDIDGVDGLWNFGYFVIDVTQAVTTPPPAGVPEPASVILMAGGLAMMGIAARRRRNASLSRTAPTLH
jgi:hypothetical protein